MSLTKITKWATGIFFAMALILGFVKESAHRSNSPAFLKDVAAKPNANAGWRAARHSIAGSVNHHQQFIFVACNPNWRRSGDAAAEIGRHFETRPGQFSDGG